MKQLNKKEVEEINRKLAEEKIEYAFEKKARILSSEAEGIMLIIADKKAVFLIKNQRIIPTLHVLTSKKLLPFVTVDMGAVKFVASGADIMRPGITSTEPFQKNTIVAVVDQQHRKPICIAETIYGSEEMMSMEKGKALKNLHYAGDFI